MIEIALAHQLREAGLVWKPAPLDFFALPDRQLDDDVFVISDQAAFLQLLNGYPALSFHGSAEWALDYILLNEVIWMPTETQLREQIEQRIPANSAFLLQRTAKGYSCTINDHTFDATKGDTALALALLQLLHDDTRPIDDR